MNPGGILRNHKPVRPDEAGLLIEDHPFPIGYHPGDLHKPGKDQQITPIYGFPPELSGRFRCR